MSRPARLAFLLVALALSLTTPTIASSPTTARAAAPVTACTGAAGCHLVASVDVDGDGRPDQVGVTVRRLHDNGTITVRVRTAAAQAAGTATVQTTGRHVYWFVKPFFAAVPLDGRPGAEIVVGDTMGAHAELSRVITWRDGRLVTEDQPPYAYGAAGLKASTPRWYVDGSYSFNYGVTRTVSAKGVVTLTLRSAERNDNGRGHTGHTSVYRWHSDGWVLVSTTKVRYSSDKAAFAVGGWHVPGMRLHAAE